MNMEYNNIGENAGIKAGTIYFELYHETYF